jgi:cell division protein FtsI (penicillin-binding protein 3)
MLLVIAFVLTLFGGRLVQLQGMESASYRKLANGLQFHSVTLQGLRGTIYSEDGQQLAMTVETYTVTADPAQMTAAKMPAYAAKLARLLGLSSQKVLAMLQHPTKFGGGTEWIVLEGGVSASVDDEITALNIPGITTGSTYARVYPDGTATANVVGYTQAGSNGVMTGQQGIEAQYNHMLSGRNGREDGYIGTDGQTIPLKGGTITPATNGSSVTLTINSALQYQAQSACQKQVAAMHARDCTVVIMQPKTGDILAMAQWPSPFQPGAPQSPACPSGTTNPGCWEDLPLQAIFEPGSTAKVITAAAALEHGVPKQTPMTPYNIPYGITEGGQVIHDSEPAAPGTRYTIAGIIANSSNVGMAQVANTITPQTQDDYLRAFGLDQPTGLDLPQSDGELPKLSQWWPDERYTLAYGQGVDVNAVQMASVYATLANGGVRVTPRIVAYTTGPSGKKTPAPPSTSRRVIQPTTARELLEILQQVPGVDASAGIDVGVIPGYAIAAKTGTSNETSPSCPQSDRLCEYGSSYIGMAPGDDPQVVVAVNVQDPEKRFGYFGDVVAGPVFNQVIKDAIQTLQIQPDEPTVPYVRLNAP